MEETANVLQVLVSIGFAVLAVACWVRWARSRERVAALLASAITLLAVVVVLGRVQDTIEQPSRALSNLSIAGFLASGYLLLLFRHGFIALPRWVRLGVAAALAAIGVFVFVVAPPTGDDPRYTTVQQVAVLAALVGWALCVIEPCVRFWLASRGRPTVQRRRLRLLTVAYGSLVLLVALAYAGQAGRHPGIEVAINGVALALIPILYASFSPPTWLRAVWRASDEGSLILTEGLVAFAPDRTTLAQRAVEQAARLTGADAAFVTDNDGTVIATLHIDPEGARRLAAGEGPVDPVDRSHVALVPLVAVDASSSGGRAVLGVILGPFTPLFGSDELAQLRNYAAVLGVTLDRVRLVEALRAETTRYTALLQAVSDVGEGFIITQEGRCVYANEAYCNMTGYSLGELMAMPSLLELSRPEDRVELTERLQNRLSGEAVSDFYESSLVRKDGTIRTVDVAVKLLRFEGEQRIISLVRDITDRKSAEDRLRQQTSTLRLLNRIAVAANQAEDVDNVFRVALEEICSYTGWPVGHVYLSPGQLNDELVSTRIWHTPGGAGYDALRAATESTRVPNGMGLPGRVLDSGEAQLMTDLEQEGDAWRKKEAMAAGLRTSYAFPILAGRDVVGVVEFFSDEGRAPSDDFLDAMTNVSAQLGRVVERKRIDEFRSDFISNAAHELRTPVTPIVGYSALLADRWGDMADEERGMMISTLRGQANRLRALVNSLLDFTRVERGRIDVNLEPVELAGVFEEVVKAVPPPEGKTVSIARVDGAVALADKARLEDMLVNLVVNAYRYGGDSILMGAETSSEDVLVSVADNGPGVDPKLVPTLFDPFTRGEGSAEIGGSGLGLAIVRMLGRAQGGDVWYEPRGDAEGARFVVRLRLPGA